MFSTFVISFREFLEVFLIIGVFLGISKKLGIKREKEILIASSVGIVISLLLPILTFFFADQARYVLTEKNAELLEGYLMIFSGFFLAYVIFSLHKLFVLKRSKAVLYAHEKLKRNIFDLSLFATIVFLIIREGFEIALFTATTSLFAKFAENLAGLMLGFAGSSIIGALTFAAYIRLSIGKIYKATQYLIVLLGAALVKNGIGELTEVYFDLHLSDVLPVKLAFLPAKSTLIGHLLKSMTGLEQNFSLFSLTIITSYILTIYYFLMRKRTL